MPSFVFLSEEGAAQENNDPPEEITLGGKLVAQRAEILKSHEEKESNKALITASAVALGGDEEVVPDGTERKMKGRRGVAKAKPSTSKVKKTAGKSRRSKLKEEAAEGEICTPAPESENGHDVPQLATTHPITNQYPHHQYQRQPLPTMETHVTIHRNSSSLAAGPSGVDPPHRHRFSPYSKSSSKQMHDRPQRSLSRLHSVAPRSMLQHTWHIISTTDPLLDSDNEELEGEHIRHDYIQRLRVISALRRKEPTPESEQIVMQVAVADPHGYLSD